MEQFTTELQEIAARIFATRHSDDPFVPGESKVPVTGKFFGAEEIQAGMLALSDFWLTSGPCTETFEKMLARQVSVRHALMVNSGSSANLVAISTLMSMRLGDRRLVPGDEVITVAAGFPTTVAPIIQNGLVPVYVDVDLGTYVANSEALEAAVGPRTRAIMMAHTLGNPFNLEIVQSLVDKHDLWLIEDNCDGLGGTYQNQSLGSFGDMSTLSFYPAHHITTGEGGAVLTRRAALKPIIESIRDWGRDCWCQPGHDNTCMKRYQWTLGDLPHGYDHKYTYSHLGYNLKSGDVQAAIGVEQLKRLSWFIERRRDNWHYLRSGLDDLSHFLLLPSETEKSCPSWFGFAILVKKESPVSRNDLVQHLNSRNIGTRLLFAGNLIRQPAFLNTPRRIVGSLENSDQVMEQVFWIGVWPGITRQMLDFVIGEIHSILEAND